MLSELKSKAWERLLVSKVIFKNPKYLKYLLATLRSPLNSGMPWLNFATKEWLDKNLSKEMIIFEYGCGGSTLYFSARVKKIISVEHDRTWYEVVKEKLIKNKINNCELSCCPPEEARAGVNKLYLSSDENFSNKSFQKYIEKINDYPDDSFDLIIVDGRARNGCISNLLPKIKNNGYVLLDNSERMEYEFGAGLLGRFEVKKFFSPGFYSKNSWEAKIWQIKK
ncbi:MAG: hypothetical protein PHE24_06015 [Patescibacteria group bacterium]|nr:hypothetical protein [Patescibacteria group bacterium]